MEFHRPVLSPVVSRVTVSWAVISCPKAKVNSAVQVHLSGVYSEDKHPEGEPAGCGDSILQQLNGVVIWIGTLSTDEVPADRVMSIVLRCRPTCVNHCGKLTAVSPLNTNFHKHLLVYLQIHTSIKGLGELSILIWNHPDPISPLTCRKLLVDNALQWIDFHIHRKCLVLGVYTAEIQLQTALPVDGNIGRARNSENKVLINEVGAIGHKICTTDVVIVVEMELHSAILDCSFAAGVIEV